MNNQVTIQEKVNLANYLSMRIGGIAAKAIFIESVEQLKKVLPTLLSQKEKFYVIGGGTNTLHIEENYEGTILFIRIPGRTKMDSQGLFEFGAGEILDDIIPFSLEEGYAGLESLSKIPGTIGAAPVQNAGAYGSEIGDVLEYVKVVQISTNKELILKKEDLELSYRKSIFNSNKRGEFIITAVGLRLHQATPPELEQALLRRQEVTQKRSERVKDPKEEPNCGSFFKNPMVSQDFFNHLKEQDPDLRGYDYDGQVKLSAGQLISKVTKADEIITGICVPKMNALILVNVSAKSYLDLLQAQQEIQRRVKERFHVDLVREVNTFE